MVGDSNNFLIFACRKNSKRKTLRKISNLTLLCSGMTLNLHSQIKNIWPTEENLPSHYLCCVIKVGRWDNSERPTDGPTDTITDKGFNSRNHAPPLRGSRNVFNIVFFAHSIYANPSKTNLILRFFIFLFFLVGSLKVSPSQNLW